MSTVTSTKAFLKGAVGRFIFRDASVVSAEHLGPHYRRLVLRGSDLSKATWTPGDKLQIFLPEIGTRTYTPMSWDPNAGETTLLAYLHGDGPAAKWARSVQPGDTIQVFGPRSSLVVGGPTPAIVFGDETSIGLAVANGTPGRAVLEVTDLDAARKAAEAVGLIGTVLIERQAGDAHHPALVDAVAQLIATNPEAPLVLSGRGAAIQAVRQGLKARGSELRHVRAKAYWAPGKVGLD